MLHGAWGHAVGGHEGLLLVGAHVGEPADAVGWRGVHCLRAAALVLLHLYCCALLLRDALRLHHETEVGRRVWCWEAVCWRHGHALHTHLRLWWYAFERHLASHTWMNVWHWHGCAHAVWKLLHRLLLRVVLVLAWHGEVGGAVILRVVAHVWRRRSIHVRVTALLPWLSGRVGHL